MNTNQHIELSPFNQRLRDLAERYADCARRSLGQNLTSVVLFGSVARGEATPESDIDLLLVARQLPKGAFQRRTLLDPARESLLTDLEVLWAEDIYVDFSDMIKTEAEAQRFHLLYLDLTEEAVLLYDRDGFFAGVLERLRQQLAALGSRRRRVRPGVSRLVSFWRGSRGSSSRPVRLSP